MCSYQGHEFGASYPDSICIDGYLWDADSGGPGESLTFGGPDHGMPCPACDVYGYLEYYHDGEDDVTPWNELTTAEKGLLMAVHVGELEASPYSGVTPRSDGDG